MEKYRIIYRFKGTKNQKVHELNFNNFWEYKYKMNEIDKDIVEVIWHGKLEDLYKNI